MNALKRRRIGDRGVLLGFCLLFAASIIAAQATGQPRLNVYFVKGFNDAAWQQEAFNRVAKAWVAATPPALDKKAVVITAIERDGKLKEAKLTTESGGADWDKAALEAVKAGAPFPAVPKSWTPATLEVHFHFEYVKP
jgi:TonB family protein